MAGVDRWTLNSRRKVGDFGFYRSTHCKDIVHLGKYLARKEPLIQEGAVRSRNCHIGWQGSKVCNRIDPLH